MVTSAPGATRVNVVIPDDITGAGAKAPETERLRAAASVEIHGSHIADELDLIDRIRNTDAVLSFRPTFTSFPGTVIANCPKLHMIWLSGTAVDDIDVGEATRHGAAVANVVSSSNRAVAESAMAMMFDVACHLSAQDCAIKEGGWESSEGIELAGKTLGIIGPSAIAQDFAELASGMGMRGLSWSRNNDPPSAGAAGATAAAFDGSCNPTSFCFTSDCFRNCVSL